MLITSCFFFNKMGSENYLPHIFQKREANMRGLNILLAFFTVFAVASILIPVPLFPGNFVSVLLGEGLQDYVRALSAVLNGAFYGVILWLMFIGIGKKLAPD
jgi:hypothetical protein